MTEVWKSQAKKFCEICKCWFSDNKMSIRGHENGVRHKENVKKKVSEMARKGKQQDRDNRDLNNTVRQMELAALQTYKRDAKESPELAGQYNIHMNIEGLPIRAGVVPKPAVPYYPMFPGAHGPDLTGESSRAGMDLETATFAAVPPPDSSYGGVAPQKLWAEAKNADGFSYYWHTVTGATRWVAPAEGYLTEEEQQHVIETEQRMLKLRDFP